MYRMIKYFALSCITVLSVCCQTKTNVEITSSQNLMAVNSEIKQRHNDNAKRTFKLNDTSKLSFKTLEVKDARFKDSVLDRTFKFYKNFNFKTRWLTKDMPTPLLLNYLNVLEKSRYYGLNPETYLFSSLRTIPVKYSNSQLTINELTKLDKQITASFFLFTAHLIEGRIFEVGYGDNVWRKRPENKDEEMLLAKISDVDDFEYTMELLHPDFPFYHRMREKLKELIDTTEADTIKQFAFDDVHDFKIGYTNANVRKLRDNLILRGYKVKTDTLNTSVDSILYQNLKKFQRDKGIEVDGLPGNNTLYYLNLSMQQEKELLILNMERLRWLNKDFGNEFILVNIPEFKLYMYKDQKLQFKMDVIVGSEYNSTPIFFDKMEYLEFRPTWTVPQSIINNEMIPMLVKDPMRYSRKGFTIYEHNKVINPKTVDWSDKNISKRYFTFIEEPSERNSLGLVKFIFPNNLSVYLHDTPSDHLFDRNDRALSHGCVRVEEPAQLATFLLKDKPEWNLDKVRDAMKNGNKQHRVYFDKDIYVQLTYLTAIVDKNDELQLMDDIYGHDKRQLALLKKYL